MSLVARLEQWSKEFDRIRWRDGDYDLEAVEIADLLKEAARTLTDLHHIVDRPHEQF